MTTTTRDADDELNPHGLPDLSTVIFNSGRESRVWGLQVGVLFVRAACVGEYSTSDTGRRTNEAGKWIVDLLNSEIGLVTVRTFANALLVADEVSRFAPELEHAPQTLNGVARALGPMMRWIPVVQECDRNGATPPGYREWRGIKGA